MVTSSKKTEFILFILLIALINLLAVGRSLGFGLNGDDWQALYFYITRFTDLGSHFDLRNFATGGLSNYTFAHIIMGLIYRLFSFNPLTYYSVSLTFRISAALSFYPAVALATKSKLAGYLTALLFSVMFAGVETTNWVFNMNTYVSMTLFNIFIYLYVKLQKFTILKVSLISVILALSFIITPNRMHGLLFVLPFLILWKLNQLNNLDLKRFIAFGILLYLPIFIFRFLTRSTSDLDYGPILIKSLTDNHILKSILESIANAAVPQKVYEHLKISQDLKAILTVIVLFFFMVFFFKTRKNFPRISKFALLSLVFSFSFVLMPLLVFDPEKVIDSDNRYLIIPGGFIMTMYACFFTILWKTRKLFLKTGALIFVGTAFLVNIFFLQKYFNLFSKEGRLAEDQTRYFKYIESQIVPENNNAPLVILLSTDDTFKLYNSITFGFSYHMMLIDKRFGLDVQKAPFAVDNFESLVNVVSSPESSELKRYGYKPVKIPLENIYFFKLENNILTNITPQGRKDLKAQLPAL